jgi:hypothetical protein
MRRSRRSNLSEPRATEQTRGARHTPGASSACSRRVHDDLDAVVVLVLEDLISATVLTVSLTPGDARCMPVPGNSVPLVTIECRPADVAVPLTDIDHRRRGGACPPPLPRSGRAQHLSHQSTSASILALRGVGTDLVSVRPAGRAPYRTGPWFLCRSMQIDGPDRPAEDVGRMRTVVAGGRARPGGRTDTRSVPTTGDVHGDAGVLRGGLYGARPERGRGGGQAPPLHLRPCSVRGTVTRAGRHRVRVIMQTRGPHRRAYRYVQAREFAIPRRRHRRT